MTAGQGATPKPQRLPAYVATVAALGWPLAFWLAVETGTPPPWQAGALAVAVLLSVWIPLRFQHDGDSFGVTLEEAVLVAILALGAGSWAGVLLGGAVTFGHVILRSRPTKVLFNGALVALCASLSAVVFRALAPAAPLLSARWLVGIVAAVAIYAIVSTGAVTQLFRLLEGRTRAELVREIAPMAAATTLGNLIFGVLLAFLAVTDDRMLLTGIALNGLVQLGYRGYARMAQDRTRTELLQETTRTLVEVAGDPARFGEFLVRLAALLGGRRAELVLVPHGATRCITGATDGSTGEHELDPGSATAEALRTGTSVLRPGSDDGTVSAIAVPVISDGVVLGSIAVLERHGLEPWSEIDLGQLVSLAHEAAAALRTVELFRQVMAERSRYAHESRKLTDVVNATSDGIVTLDATGKVTVWNDAIATITGTAADDALGRPWFSVLRLRDDHERDLGDQQRNVITEVLEDSVPATGVNLQVLRRDGQWRWLRCTLNPVLSKVGASGVVVVARDVTADIEIEQMKADFLATVSHELRTPLTPLMGFVETLDRFGADLSDEQRTRSLGAMRSQIQRLGRLVDDLLTTTELDRGITRLGAEPLVAGEVVQSVVDRLPTADRARVELGIVDRPRILGDRGALDRIVGELVDNALKHTVGTVAVHVAAVAHGVGISVTDQGPGIAPRDHARVFERFGRLGDHLHRPQGPGLGLPIVRGLAEELGGRIDLDSDADRGSIFALTLPAADPDGLAGGPGLVAVR